MITYGWMMLVGMIVMGLTGLITRSTIVMIVAATFAIPLVINAEANLERIMWAGVGVIWAFIAIGMSFKSKSKDDY